MVAIVIKEADDPGFFRFVTDANLLRQYDFLKTVVEIALKKPHCIITHDIVADLNRYAVAFLTETPGVYREGPIHITNSKHVPPPYEEVKGYMEDFLNYMSSHWDTHSATHLSAYALWRLNWTHPFTEGNGRTARATSYLVLCAKYGIWLPGVNTIPMQIRQNRKPYYDALALVDSLYASTGKIDVSAVEKLIEELLTKQLTP